ncbi:hypothetical protein AAC387_Pa03g2655 [Persea americana]
MPGWMRWSTWLGALGILRYMAGHVGAIMGPGIGSGPWILVSLCGPQPASTYVLRMSIGADRPDDAAAHGPQVYKRDLKPLNMDPNLVQIHDQDGAHDEGGLF